MGVKLGAANLSRVHSTLRFRSSGVGVWVRRPRELGRAGGSRQGGRARAQATRTSPASPATAPRERQPGPEGPRRSHACPDRQLGPRLLGSGLSSRRARRRAAARPPSAAAGPRLTPRPHTRKSMSVSPAKCAEIARFRGQTDMDFEIWGAATTSNPQRATQCSHHGYPSNPAGGRRHAVAWGCERDSPRTEPSPRNEADSRLLGALGLGDATVQFRDSHLRVGVALPGV